MNGESGGVNAMSGVGGLPTRCGALHHDGNFLLLKLHAHVSAPWLLGPDQSSSGLVPWM